MYAEQHESDEERQFRQVFKQLAGEVGFSATFAPSPTRRSLLTWRTLWFAHVSACVIQDMEVSPTELMNILNRIIKKRKACLFESRFTSFVASGLKGCLCVSDGDLKTDGFSIESCRSMVAVMDVSFVSLNSSDRLT